MQKNAAAFTALKAVKEALEVKIIISLQGGVPGVKSKNTRTNPLVILQHYPGYVEPSRAICRQTEI